MCGPLFQPYSIQECGGARLTVDITYLGGSSFHLRGRDASLVVDPAAVPDRRANARAILMSLYGTDPAVDVGEARAISRPGEYEVSGILIKGVRTSRASASDSSHPGGMAYSVAIDGVTICHLGRLSRVLTTGEISELGEVDVVLLPVGGEETLPPNMAAQVVTQLGPSIVVPMLWSGAVERSVSETPPPPAAPEGDAQEGGADESEETPPAPTETANVPSLEPFLRELGVRSLTPHERLSVTPTNQPATQQVSLLIPRG